MDETNRERFARAAREESPDPALLCLLMAAEAGPGPDGDGGAASARAELDRLCSLVEPPAAPCTPRRWAEALAEALGTRAGLHGTRGDYRRLESSLLPEVLHRRRGLPILLSVVWLEVGRRVGAPVYGVALPGHFAVGVGDPAGEHVLADPFDGGRVMTDEDVRLLVAGATGAPEPTAAMLAPAGPLEIVLRVLNNVRAWAAARPERSDVHLWAVDLSLLLPSHPARLRYERAQLLVQRGEFVAGARALTEYADLVAAMEPSAAETVRRQARAARAMLN